MSKKFWQMLCASVLAMQAGTALAGATVSTPPAANTPEAVVRQALLKLVPKAQIDQVAPSPLPGFYQVIASGHLVYVSSDGKYLINGDVIDTSKGSSLTDDAWAAYRKTQLAKVPVSDRIVFAPPNPKYTVTVFTDVTCPYCRVLHEQIKDFNKEGIAVQYLAWPRSGVTGDDGKPTKTYKEMVSIWCAADRNDAFTQAKKGQDPKPADCKNPVKDQFDLGLRLGVTGTPAVYAEDGTLIGGYLSPQDMLKAVQEHSAKGG
ncbi:thioredoxin fold domain-containing protein [Dyella sp.]|jgi:thiol:disulfide interchange protein DsbC|uniref:disulfide isomerase DsbC N-terminal domain-containing protein n=1 Tax=Dyella sp. TaxID=1869338 RepID=UPI002FD9AE39